MRAPGKTPYTATIAKMLRIGGRRFHKTPRLAIECRLLNRMAATVLELCHQPLKELHRVGLKLEDREGIELLWRLLPRLVSGSHLVKRVHGKKEGSATTGSAGPRNLAVP